MKKSKCFGELFLAGNKDEKKFFKCVKKNIGGSTPFYNLQTKAFFSGGGGTQILSS